MRKFSRRNANGHSVRVGVEGTDDEKHKKKRKEQVKKRMVRMDGISDFSQ